MGVACPQATPTGHTHIVNTCDVKRGEGGEGQIVNDVKNASLEVPPNTCSVKCQMDGTRTFYQAHS